MKFHKTTIKTKHIRLMGLTAVLLSGTVISNAYGDPIADLTKQNQSLQDQIHALQSQMEQMKAYQQGVANIANDAVSAATAKPAAAPVGGVQNKNIKITFGGFIEAAGIYRNKNQTADVGSNFNSGIPFENSPNAHLSEFRGSARQSRLSILAQGNVDANTALGAYYEMDFLAAAPTANSNQSNSYSPRIRNVYATLDRTDIGLHLLAGQNWSLATLNRQGIVPRNEVAPAGIEAQYVVGFNWTRNPQVRLVEDFDQKYWLAVSAESPAAIVSAGPGATLAPPLVINNPGTSQLGQGGNFTTDPTPDMIGKFAADPGWGHYEVFGIGRWFRSRAAFNNITVTGGGVGGSALLPLMPKVLDFQISGLVGKGLGRYGSAGLPDVTVDPFGHLKPLHFSSALMGLVAHPDSAFDVYAYAGTEQVEKQFYSVGTTAYGYGNPLLSNAGCQTESVGTCTGNTSRVYELTGGFWYKFYQGTFGYMEFGLQDELVKRYAFTGVGGAPTANANIAMASFRYYPF